MTPEEKEAFTKRLHKKMAECKEHKKKHYVKPYPPSRYDEVYFKGLEWLNSL